MFTSEQLREIYRRLAEPFPEEAIERTRADVTKKGYDTSGIKYQYVVNRLNEVLGVGGFRVTREFALRERQSRSGYPMVEATCDLTMQLGQWVDGQFQPFAEATGTGGHVAASEADAKKGAFTNGFKKVAAFFGCGWEAYAGRLDDDSLPPEDARGVVDRPARAPKPRAAAQPPQEHAGPTGNNGGASDNGRITSAQVAKLREIIAQRGGDWAAYREDVRQKHGINIEYADRRLASELIRGLLAASRRGNGAAARVA